MTADAVSVVRLLFTSIWRFFTELHFPGTNVTPAGMFLFVIVCLVGLKFFKRVLGRFSGGGDK